MSERVVHVTFPATGTEKPAAKARREMGAAMDDMMAEMFGMSMDVLRDELDMSNPRVAMWFADTYLKKYGSRMSGAIKIKVDNARDIEEASKQVVIASAEGLISFEDAKNVQEALARHAVLAGIRTVEELRGSIDELEARRKAPKHGLNGHTPSWGRLGGKEPKGKATK